MGKQLTAILIDPFEETVKEVTVEKINTKDIYRHLQCDCFDVVYLENNDCIYVDDEGLLGDMSEQRFFYYKGCYNPLAGRGLILGTTSDGYSKSPVVTLEEVKSKVSFVVPLNVGGDIKWVGG